MSKRQSSYAEDFGDAFQRHILAVTARVPGFAMRIRDVLDHRYFVSDAHRKVAEALLAHVDEYQNIPTRSTLVEAVRSRVSADDMELLESTIREIYREPVHDAEAVEKRCVEFGKRQAMLNAVMEGALKLDRGEPEAVEPLIRKALLVGEDLTQIGTNWRDNLKDRVKSYKNPERDSSRRIPTGIAHLDHVLRGGLPRGALGCLLAPPKRGKTTFLVNFGFAALASLAGMNVFHYTLEMSEADILRRYDDRLMGPLVRHRASAPESFTSELSKRMGKLVHGRLAVKEYPTRSATVAMLRSNLSVHAAQGYSPDLVLVDYAGIMRPSTRRAGEYRHEQASIYEDLRALAGEFDTAIWTAHQANRSSLDKETIGMADASETFEVAAIVDAFIAICQTPDEVADGVCRLFGAAMRGVESEWTVSCRIRRDECRVASFSAEDASRSRIYTPEDKDVPEQPDQSKPAKLAKARRAGGVVKPKQDGKHKIRTAIPSKKVPTK